MKNVINWTIGSFFRTIGRIVAYIGIGCLLALILSKSDIDITNIFMPKLSAATLTPKSTYTNNSNHIIGQDISSFGSNNTYSYSTVLPNLYGEFLWENSSTGTAVSGKAYAFSLGFQYNLTAQKYYDITINFRDRDLRSVVNTSSIELLGGTSISGLSSNNLSLIGVTNTATSSSNTNKLVVRVYSVQALSYFVVQIYNMQNNITSVNNFGISSVSIQEVDITNSQAIINNQTNNTQNIINNQNETTQQILDSNLVCKTYDKSNISIDNYYLKSDGSQSFTNNYGITDYININNSKVKVLVPLSVSSISSLCFYDINKSLISCIPNTDLSTNNYINIPSSSAYVRFSINKNTNEPQFSVCSNGNQSINDTLNDDNVDDSKVNNAINGIEIPQTSLGPFAAFLTIPLQWVQTLLATGQTCQTLHLPLPFVNQNLDLPCMTDFWTSTGAIGILIQACWIAVVAVRIFNGLFLLTVDVLNPNPDSAAELTKIKSWEL